MSSKTKDRPSSGLKDPNLSSHSLSIVMEPPHNLFPSMEELLRLIAVVAIASSVALTCNFIASYFNPSTKPFCDTNNIDSSDSFSDFCEPCPINGECTQGKLECTRGYKKHGNICVEDGDINERAKKLSEWVENHLCEAYAQFLCKGIGAIWVQENDIWKDLGENQLMENLQPGNPLYMYTKKRAMAIISSFLEMRTSSHGNKELKCPDSVAEYYKPLICRLQQWISKHALIFAPLCAMLVHSIENVPVLGSMLLLRKVKRRWYLSSRGEEPYCQVEELIEEDSQVDRYPKLKGESKVVWEWQVEGSWSSARMRKKVGACKLKSIDGVNENPDQQMRNLKSEPKTLVF